MLPIEKYIDAIENKDYEGLGSLFTKDGHYCDYCANGTAQHDYHLYGREAISMFFRNKFLCRQYSILEPTVLSPSQAEPCVRNKNGGKLPGRQFSSVFPCQISISFCRCLRTTLKCFFRAFAPAASSWATSAS